MAPPSTSSYRILQWPNPRLRQHATLFDPRDILTTKTRELVIDMCNLVRAHRGLGLAAVQVGVARSLFLINAGAGIEVFFNPVVERIGEKAPILEGCLSLPGIMEYVERFPDVIVRALNESGAPFERRLSGLRAQIAQHEADHLDGQMFVDRLSPGRRGEIRAQLRNRH